MGRLTYLRDRREFRHLTALGTMGAALIPGCAAGPIAPPNNIPLNSGGRIQLGIDALEADGFASLRGVRCGLVTHRAGVNGNGLRTVDVLARAPGVR